MIAPGASLIDVAFAACTVLDRTGLTAILCGGSAATFYAPDAYMSADADFVLRFDVSRRELSPILAQIGFRESGRIYVHDAVTWTLDFPAGPLSVGRDLITSWETVQRDDQVLHVVSPTDCVRDRFMHYFAWNDYSGLVQAVAVAKSQRKFVDLNVFRTWAADEIAHNPVYDQRRVNRFFRELKRR